MFKKKKGILLSFHLACWPIFLVPAHSFFLPRLSLSLSFLLGPKPSSASLPRRTAAAQQGARPSQTPAQRSSFLWPLMRRARLSGVSSSPRHTWAGFLRRADVRVRCRHEPCAVPPKKSPLKNTARTASLSHLAARSSPTQATAASRPSQKV